MLIEVDHPSFTINRLSVQTVGLTSKPQLLVNGDVIATSDGSYKVISDTSEEMLILLKRHFFDPVPKLLINNDEVKLARSFNALEYIWFAFLVLSFANAQHPLGGLVGGIAALASARVFRAKYSSIKKIVFIVVIVACSLQALVVISVFTQMSNKS